MRPSPSTLAIVLFCAAASATTVVAQPIAPEFRVNSLILGDQTGPEVAMRPDGRRVFPARAASAKYRAIM